MSKNFVLKAGSHEATTGDMCAMEAVAYLAGEAHSDRPACASSAIAAAMRAVNDSVYWQSDEQRTQMLTPYLRRLIGSRSDLAREVRLAAVAARAAEDFANNQNRSMLERRRMGISLIEQMLSSEGL